MEGTRRSGRGPRRRRSREQREPLDAAASPAERGAVVEEVRHAHAEKALEEAVTAGRLSPVAAQAILARLARGSDPHALRRELRAAGVLTRRSAHNKHDEGDSNA